MRINGAGGCFDNRIYENLDMGLAWNVAALSINEMGVTMDSIDEEHRIYKFHNKEKFMQVCIQDMGDGTLQVIMDSIKEHLEIYSWKPENKEVNLFYSIFEKKLREFRAFVICPVCGEKASSLARFCPQCGSKLK